jgi:hypothetical protein
MMFFKENDRGSQVYRGLVEIQIRRTWLNQLKHFFSKHCKDYYFLLLFSDPIKL